MCTRRELLEGRSRSEWEHLINEWIFDEIDRYILRRKLLDGITYDKITEEVNDPDYCMEIGQVKRRFYAASDRLFKAAH